MFECNHYAECKNFPDKCFRCSNEKLYTPTVIKRKYTEKKRDIKKANSKDSWKDLEQNVADALNNVPTMREARRARASGALWFEKGDIVDAILHPECKERTAEKSFSIKKEWLDKALNECKYENKTMCLPFRFKGDDQIYTVMRNQDIMSLVTLIKAYMEDNDKLLAENEALKKEINKLVD